jgi:uncharacterized protein YuzE
MNITYNDKTDMLYIRLNVKKHSVTNRRVDEDIVLDVGAKAQIIGIEIMNASRHVRLEEILPVKYLGRKTSRVA